MLKTRWAIVVIFLVLGFSYQPASAQASVEVVEQHVDYLFNDSLNFHATFESSLKIIEGYAFFQVEGEDRNWVYEGDISKNENLDVAVDLNLTNAPKAFSTITYWFRLASDHGLIFESPHYTFFYEDNRFNWQTLADATFSLRWHNGDQAFAEAILAAANQGVLRAQAMLPLPNPQPMKFQVYDNVNDVQLIAQLAGYSWLAGHTDPQAALILFSLPPGPLQSLEIERQVPHEVAHLMLYQSLGAQRYANLPVWFNEGFASSVEVYSDPLQAELLDVASQTNTLLPFFSLCSAFPQDAAAARLAYAESASFVRYLFEHYKQAGFALLFDAFTETGDCQNASLPSFGKDLIGLESEWRLATFAPQTNLQSQILALPWSTIVPAAGIALLLWGVTQRLGRPKKR